jgi:hypothetical protein
MIPPDKAGKRRPSGNRRGATNPNASARGPISAKSMSASTFLSLWLPPPPQPQSDEQEQEEDGFYAEAMLNLTLLDPPRFGWTALGGVADVLPPHEVRGRKKTKDVVGKRLWDGKRRLVSPQHTLHVSNVSCPSFLRVALPLPSLPHWNHLLRC